MEYNDDNGGFIGTPLAEIFSIKLNFEADQFQVFGRISAKDKYGLVYFYNCAPNEAETIRKGRSLPLICPSRPISAASPFTITFNLKCKNQDNSESELIKNSFTWESTSGDRYDKCSFENIKGRLASAIMYMTVFKAGLWAEVEVKVIAEDRNVEDISGSVVGHFDSRFDHSGGQNLENESQIILFRVDAMEKEEIDCSKKIEGKEVRLVRPRFAVPAYSSLLLDTYLECNYSDDSEDFKRRVLEFRVTDTFLEFHVEVLSGNLRNLIRFDVRTTPRY